MSINSVSFGSNTYSQGVQSNQSNMAAAFKQRKQDFSTLSSALNSGDLQGAQKAFAALQQDQQAIQQNRGAQGADQDGDNDGSKTSSSASQRNQDMTALGSALNSGDLKGAQQALANLQQDMQASRAGHHHHHHGGNAQSASAAATSSTSSAGDNTASTGSISTTA